MIFNSKWLLALILVPLLALLAAPALADEQPARLSVGSVDSSKFPELQTTAAVFNGSGVPVLGLSKDNFQLVEDGKSLPTTSVEQVATNAASVSVVLGLDISGSMHGKPQEDAVAAIGSFVDRLSSEDTVAVLTFGGPGATVNTGPGLTNDKAAIKDFISAAEAVGDTPLYDATLTAVQTSLSAPAGRRMVVILTDGDDTASKVSPDTAVAGAVRNGIPLYFIGLGPALKPAVLQNLANLTGGQYLVAGDSSKLDGIYESLNARLRTQYLIRYTSAQLADRKEHLLSVRVKGSSGEVAGEARFTPPIVKPQLKLSIASGQKLESPTRIEVTTSSPIQLVKADFFLDDTQLQEVTQHPLVYTLDPAGLATGNHTIRVRAEDGIGSNAEASVQVEFVSTGLFGGIPFWSILAAVLVLPILAIAGMFVIGGRRNARCPTCHGKIEKGWTTCPYCSKPDPTAVPADATESGWVPATGEIGGPIDAGMMAALATGRPTVSESLGGPSSAGTGNPKATQIISTSSKPAAWLVVTSGEHEGTRFRLNEGETAIGRDSTNDIALYDNAASRQHAKIRLLDGIYYVTDLDTTNGTLVNGRRITRHKLRHGDKIAIGETTMVLMTLLSGQR